eukprot:CAMPEP_0204135232 /NCGR_PEP_ID=MMETSP0361-20130328/16130_1 /ASSEMBLY_ACC=CAM_ASM_000343 /TAXON_ID=268821 /ORGANISM="Scrippsiella Hangoei, Strain SHTV-5" /LENGTH=161 /DNA_ID=CAMNT_0051088553 /DNA_START=81 /DNA_END=563 /DNA_ORIENTATION=+
MMDDNSLPGITKVWFAMGAHGLQWKPGSTEISGVSCQARLLGIKEGWAISMINGVPITESHMAWNELLKCKKAGQKYSIYFRKDEASIRADQIKAEAERAKRQKAQDEARKREMAERKIREDAEKKRADEQAAKKQEYWDKQKVAPDERIKKLRMDVHDNT